MDRKRLLLLTICWILVIVPCLCVLLFADNKSQTNSEAEQHFEKANEFQKLSDYDAAIAEYKAVVSLSPKSAIAQNAQYWIGQIYFETRRFDDALSTFQELVNEFPLSVVVPTTKVMIERSQQAQKNRSLFEAVKKGDIEQVKRLIAEGADVDAKWGDVYNKNEGDTRLLNRFGLIDSTPLWHAVNLKNMDLVKFLVEAGADANAGKWPPLCLAVDVKNTAIAEYLINHGANVNYPKDWGPLQEAACNNIEMVKLLVARGADVNGGLYQPTIHAGIRSGYREIVEFLIQHGADINAKDEWGRGFTPLQRAAITGRTGMVKLILEAGADVNAKDDRGQTALHITVHAPLEMRRPDYPPYRLSKDTVELLLAKGADVNLRDNDGRTPLHLAAESANEEIIELLLDKGAKIDEMDDKSGFTALHYAAQFGNTDAVKVLIARGADINAKDKEGHTPLYIAVDHDYKVAQLLIEKGADSSIKTESGKTLFELAQQRKKAESPVVPDMIFEGEPNSSFGLIACGDIDGDGYYDILIGTHQYNNYRGRVYLFLGGPDMDTTPDLIFEGQNKGDWFGNGIACGDIDNDGYGDIVIGAGSYNERQGRAYLYWGSKRNSMDTNPDKIFDGEQEKGSQFGAIYPAVYDIDKDGYGDIIFGAISSKNRTGRAYLYYGNTKELMDTSYDLIFKGENPITGENPIDGFGYTISCGDIDNDGYGDIVIGSWRKGWAYLYYGSNKSNMDAKADIIFDVESEGNDYFGQSIVCIDQNRDGYDDVVFGARSNNDMQGHAYIFHGNTKKNMDVNPDITFDGEGGIRFGEQKVCGDIDKDGFEDIVITANHFRQGTGRVYVYWGNELYVSDPKPVRILTGENPDDGFGQCLACGDVNKDGFEDFVVGAPGYKAGAKQGRAYLYYGGPRNK